MTTTTAHPFVTDATDALVERLFGAVLATLDLQAVYLGDRLGYYRALAGAGALTSAELASRTGTAERYTREWLEQQAVTGLLTADAEPDAGRRAFTLPDAHVEPLTAELSPRHVVPLCRFAAGAGQQLDALAQAYRTGGGVSWAARGADAREAQAAANRPLFLGALGAEYLPSVPDLDATLRAGGRVADIGCGLGWSSVGIALAYPDATVDGYDVDPPSIEAARRHAAASGVADRVRFHLADAAAAAPAPAAAAAPGDPGGGDGGGYDVVFAFECIHDLSDPVAVLTAMRGLAGDHGTVVVMDERVAETFTAPGDEVERLAYGFSLVCCLADGMAHQPSAATGTVMRPDTLRGYAVRAGFAGIEVLDVDDPFFRFYRLTRG